MSSDLIRINVVRFGANSLLQATSPDLPTLNVIGTDDADLLECLPPVIASALGLAPSEINLSGIRARLVL